jgi:GTPase involved in cell partitioning and DNA repair
VLVPKAQLETSFLTLLGALQPTVEYLNQLSDVAAKQQEVRGESIRQELRALNIQMADQKRLNSQAIKAKLNGELSPEDFETVKENIREETKKIETALSALESERKTMEEVSRQSKLENISLVNTWRDAAVEGKIELEKLCFRKDCS